MNGPGRNFISTRETRRVKASHRVRLSAPGAVEVGTATGEALLSNLAPDGVCLQAVKWEAGADPSPEALIDVHLALPDWVGVHLAVRPVRVRFSDDSMEIGAVIVRKPARFAEVLEALGFGQTVEVR